MFDAGFAAAAHIDGAAAQQTDNIGAAPGGSDAFAEGGIVDALLLDVDDGRLDAIGREEVGDRVMAQAADETARASVWQEEDALGAAQIGGIGFTPTPASRFSTSGNVMRPESEPSTVAAMASRTDEGRGLDIG